MKTIREYIDLIENAQNPVDDDVEHLANVAADAYWSGKFGMTSATEKVKMARDIVQAVEDGRLSIEELRQDIRDLDNKGVAEGTNGWVVYNIRGRIIKNFADEAEARQYAKQYGFYVKPQGVAEALSKKDLLSRVAKDLNSDEFKNTPVDPTKSFTKGDHWQGAKPGDYGYTGYQGHGMPTDKAERARIRADKKKGLPEDEATAQKYAVRMNAQQLGSTNRTKYTWTGTASSDDQAREMAIAYADRHGFKNIVVKEISKKE